MNELVQRQDFNLEAVFMKAMEKDVPVETIERLLAVRKELKAEWAKEEYYKAFSKFQSKCPVIEKKREVRIQGDLRYKYASLDDIIKQVAPILEDCGLSFTVRTEYNEGVVSADCEVNHIAGHSEVSSFAVPVGSESFMNAAQKTASAQTYAKRYAFCNAFGIVTGDTDDDVRSLGQGITLKEIYNKNVKLMKAVLENYSSIMAVKNLIAENNLNAAAEAWYELPQETQMNLWVAPSKGGPFTTEERHIIKSGEFTHSGFNLPEDYGTEKAANE